MIYQNMKIFAYVLFITNEFTQMEILHRVIHKRTNNHILAINWQQAFNIFLIDPIISINKTNILTNCIIQTKIASRTYPSILLMKYSYTTIILCIFIANLPRRILTSIIYQQQLKIGKRLDKNTINTANKVLLCIIYRNDNGYYRHFNIRNSCLLPIVKYIVLEYFQCIIYNDDHL